MICVSIGRMRHKMVRAEHRHLAEQGAQLVEIRLDWLGSPAGITRLLRNRPTPVIMTCRRAEDGGRWTGTEDQRQTLLREAIVCGADYVDLEQDVARSVPRFGDTKRIVSYHNFDETPENLAGIHADMLEKDPDLIKIVTLARAPADNVRMLQLVSSSKMPTIGFCMGGFGVVSRLLCGRYGSPFTYASSSSRREIAPGQLSFDEMSKLYRYDSINRETDVYGVLGDPVAHSLSPLIHNAAFQQQNVNAVYVPLQVAADQLPAALDAFDWLRICGYSVTIPHKQAVLDKADTRDDVAARIGAANTLTIQDTRWHATNTDCDAALESIRAVRDTDDSEDPIAGRRVLMLGAGGVARAVGLAITRAQGQLTIANRTAGRAEQLARELACAHIAWDDRASADPEILINCTSAGMQPNVNETPFDAESLRTGTLVFDTVYTPENTLLLEQARARGCRTVSGMDMFVRQAARQYELFVGHTAPMDHIRETLHQHLSVAKR